MAGYPAAQDFPEHTARRRIFPGPLTLRSLRTLRGSEGLPSMNSIHRAIPEIFPVRYREFLVAGTTIASRWGSAAGAQS